MEDVYILSIIFGFSALVCMGVYKLIMAKMAHDNGIDNESFDRLAKAFMQHKKEMVQRVGHLEDAIAGLEATKAKAKDHRQIEAPKHEGILKNDLKQKGRVQS